jgi:hypothetical protein
MNEIMIYNRVYPNRELVKRFYIAIQENERKFIEKHGRPQTFIEWCLNGWEK